jgi:tight adherence protein B
LADAIDVLVASVSSGASLQASLRQASEYSPMPLRGELSEMVARLRLGDSPPDVFDLLRQRVPTETFRLFATTLTVNWTVGGELAETLAAIGSTIRDRLAIARQIRTLSTQGTLTTLTVLAVVWFMAAMMWQADPPRFKSFLQSGVGSWLVAASLFLQGVGVALVSRISRPKI